jgi:hypothetical protein
MSRRPEYTREERIAKGLPVCAVEDCPRAPAHKRCSRHPDDRLRASWDGSEVAILLRLPLALHAELRARAEAERKSLSLLLVEVLSPIAKTWGAPT